MERSPRMFSRPQAIEKTGVRAVSKTFYKLSRPIITRVPTEPPAMQGMSYQLWFDNDEYLFSTIAKLS